MTCAARAFRVLSLALALILISGTLGAAQSAQFTLIDLIRNTEEGAEAFAGSPRGINNDGTVVGFTGALPEKSSPYIYEDEDIRRVPSGEFGATLTDINDDGIVTGRTVTGRTDTGAPLGFPTTWEDDEPEALPMPLNLAGREAVEGIARAINNDGVIAGDVSFDTASFERVAVVWTDREPLILPNAFGVDGCTAWDISEAGGVAGQCFNPATGQYHPIAWIDGQPVVLDLGKHLFGIATGIVFDEATGSHVLVGEVADSQQEPTYLQPAYWDLAIVIGTPGITPLQELPTLEEMPYCTAKRIAMVTEAEGEWWIVGVCLSAIADETAQQAGVLWDETTIRDLNEITDAGAYRIVTAESINDAGQITGIAIKRDVVRGVLLTPEF